MSYKPTRGLVSQLSSDDNDCGPLLALLKAVVEVRSGEWVLGAPSHIFSELLDKLKENGWVLTQTSAQLPYNSNSEIGLRFREKHQRLNIDHIPNERHWGMSMWLHDHMLKIDHLHEETWELCKECDTLSSQLIHILFDTEEASKLWEEKRNAVQLEHSTKRIVNVHSKELCDNQSACSIHNRTNHSMRLFPQHFRSDRGIMERICPHGVGHPDPDDMAWREDKDVQSIHGCDGCCHD